MIKEYDKGTLVILNHQNVKIDLHMEPYADEFELLGKSFNSITFSKIDHNYLDHLDDLSDLSITFWPNSIQLWGLPYIGYSIEMNKLDMAGSHIGKPKTSKAINGKHTFSIGNRSSNDVVVSDIEQERVLYNVEKNEEITFTADVCPFGNNTIIECTASNQFKFLCSYKTDFVLRREPLDLHIT